MYRHTKRSNQRIDECRGHGRANGIITGIFNNRIGLNFVTILYLLSGFTASSMAVAFSIEPAISSHTQPTEIECNREDSPASLFETWDQTAGTQNSQPTHTQMTSTGLPQANDNNISTEKAQPPHPDSIAFAALAVLLLSLIVRWKSFWFRAY